MSLNAGMEAAVDAGPAVPGSPDLDAVAESVEEFWSEVDETAGFDFESIGDRFYAASELPDPDAVCQGQSLTAADVEENAFAIDCPEGITVAYDDQGLFPRIADDFGQVAPAIVVAHEWGHVVQFQGVVDDFLALPDIVTELQADCLAGAWVRFAFERGEEPFTSDSVVPDMLGTVVEFRDPVGTAADVQNAHGSGFDRVRAFQEGFEQGVEVCLTYDDPDRDLGVTAIPFVNEADLENEGNLPFDEMVPLVADDLDLFWSPVENFEDEGDPLAGLDEALLRELHGDIGDNAVGVLISLAYAAQAQQAVGASVTGEEPALQRACLTGVWLGQVARGDGTFSLSPGDFDEAIFTFLRLADRDDPTQAFDLTASLREGFVASAEDPGETCGLG